MFLAGGAGGPKVQWGATGPGHHLEAVPTSAGLPYSFLLGATLGRSQSLLGATLGHSQTPGLSNAFTWQYIGPPPPLALDLAYESVGFDKAAALATRPLALQQAWNSLP